MRVLLYSPPTTFSRPPLFEYFDEKYLNHGGIPTRTFSVSGRRQGVGWLKQKWLDRNEVEFWMGGFAMLYFCCLSFGGLAARMCTPEQDSKADSFSGVHIRTAGPPNERQQRHHKSAHPNSLSFLSKPLLFQPPRTLPPAGYRKLCIGTEWLRYFSFMPESCGTDFMWVENSKLRQNIYYEK